MENTINEARVGFRVTVTAGPNIYALYKRSVSGLVQTTRITPQELYEHGVWKSEEEAWEDALAHVAKWHEDIRYTADPFDDDADHTLEEKLTILVTPVEVCRDTTFTVTTRP